MKGTSFFLGRFGIWILFFSLSFTINLFNPSNIKAQQHGDVVRAQGDTKIYLIQSGQRRAFATEEIFSQMGYKPSDVKELDSQALMAIPEGPPIWSKEIVGALPDGTLMLLKGTAQTYVIQGGKKSYIPDPETFQSKGYQWDQVIEVDRTIFDSILTGIPIASVKPPLQYTPPGRAPGAPGTQPPGYPSASTTAAPSTSTPTSPPYPSVSTPTTPSYPSSPSYPSPSTPSYPTPSYPSSPPSSSYPSPSYPPSSIPYPSYTSPSYTYPSPSSIFPNGTLVRGSGPEIYVIENGVKRLIPDLQTFNNLGLDQSKIITIEDMRLRSLPLGVPLPKK